MIRGRRADGDNSARKFTTIDAYVHMRLAMLASAKHGYTGRHWGRRFNLDWLGRLGIHRLTGTVRYPAANA